jgi:hypothetical protein
MSQPSEDEIVRTRRIATACDLFKGVIGTRLVFRVSYPDGGPSFPVLDVPANNEYDAVQRYDQACSIRGGRGHKVELLPPIVEPVEPEKEEDGHPVQ